MKEILVLVFAAASLTDALKEIAASWEIAGGESVVFNFAASSLLARQIREGAPADVFLSADEVVLLESGRIRARGAPGDVLRDRP